MLHEIEGDSGDSVWNGVRAGHTKKQGRQARNCEHCGTEFEPSHGKQRYCNPKCRKGSRPSPVNRIKKECLVCGAGFEARQSSQKYCSQKCGRRRYGPFECIVCGDNFRSDKKDATCCSLSCSTKRAGRRGIRSDVWREVRVYRKWAFQKNKVKRIDKLREERIAWVPLRIRSEVAVYQSWGRRRKRIERSLRLQRWREHKLRMNKIIKECEECGREYSPYWGYQAFCSQTCSKRNHTRRTNNKRDWRIKGQIVDRVDAIKVFERDGWYCQLCGRKTPRKNRGTTKANAPELDHIIPVSKDGEHSYKNTQCACRQCNIEKSNAELGQLRLFGGVGVYPPIPPGL